MNRSGAESENRCPDPVVPLGSRWMHFELQGDIGVRGMGPAREAAEDASLFVAWLNVLVYEMAVRRMPFGRFRSVAALRHARRARHPGPQPVFARRGRGGARRLQGQSAVVDAAEAAGLARKVARLEPLICIKG